LRARFEAEEGRSFRKIDALSVLIKRAASLGRKKLKASKALDRQSAQDFRAADQASFDASLADPVSG